MASQSGDSCFWKLELVGSAIRVVQPIQGDRKARGKRGEVGLAMSWQSAQRLMSRLLVLVDLVDQGHKGYFITLTARDSYSYADVYEMMRRLNKRYNLFFLWKREYQGRGAVHHHLEALHHVPFFQLDDDEVARFVASQWADIVPSGLVTKTLPIWNNGISLVAYLAKYVSKCVNQHLEQVNGGAGEASALDRMVSDRKNNRRHWGMVFVPNEFRPLFQEKRVIITQKQATVILEAIGNKKLFGYHYIPLEERSGGGLDYSHILQKLVQGGE